MGTTRTNARYTIRLSPDARPKRSSFHPAQRGSRAGPGLPARSHGVIIADGLSSDGTCEAVKAVQLENPNVVLIDNPGKIVSTGLNAALRVAKGEIIVRVDGHCEIAEGLRKPLRFAFE